MTSHGPVPPVWSCGGCDRPWPCPTRRQELRAEYADAPVSLALHLGACFVRAAGDMPWAPAGPLYRRFVGWTRQPPEVQHRSAVTVPAAPDRHQRHQAG
ncbi:MULTISPECIES: hypothetical protein [unclassified Micromonospora]|uniref:hypothetical protein n=1 Tax=unclassified Micromonospora TaxID=2617518 RepID=UPI001C5E1000|nr:hypothetical protein [Micromonospora sp. RL09-050-HVF-A]MBW4705723.1 hypothetical protein [Micromonospora sp. RL09-050-HVF-A]